MGRMRHERKEQPGVEMGKEVRTFHEKGSTETSFPCRMVSTRIHRLEDRHRSADGGEHIAAQETERLEKLDSQAALLLPTPSFYWSEIIHFWRILWGFIVYITAWKLI